MSWEPAKAGGVRALALSPSAGAFLALVLASAWTGPFPSIRPDASAWWCAMAVLATWISVSRRAWLWVRLDSRSASMSAAVFGALAGALAMGSAVILTGEHVSLVRTGGWILATAVLVWAGHWIVSKSSASAYLLVLCFLPGIAVSTSRLADGKERAIPLSRLVEPSDNRAVRWVDLAPWMAAAVGAWIHHRHGARR